MALSSTAVHRTESYLGCKSNLSAIFIDSGLLPYGYLYPNWRISSQLCNIVKNVDQSPIIHLFWCFPKYLIQTFPPNRFSVVFPPNRFSVVIYRNPISYCKEDIKKATRSKHVIVYQK